MNSIKIIQSGASSEIKKDGFQLDLAGIETWLRQKNILAENEILVRYTDLDKWFRSGGETYATTFEIEYSVNEKYLVKQLLIKAIVMIPPESHLEDWHNRRKILSDNGISVSNWYWYGNAVIIEDFYPHTVDKARNFTQLIQTALILDKLGFHAIDFLRDMRCDNDGLCYYIDFGFDLGEFSYFPKTISIENLKKNYPHKIRSIESYLNRRK